MPREVKAKSGAERARKFRRIRRQLSIRWLAAIFSEASGLMSFHRRKLRTPASIETALFRNGLNVEKLGGNKGALRIPSLSFQFLRRPGCTAKLLCFLIVGGFECHPLLELSAFFSI